MNKVDELVEWVAKKLFELAIHFSNEHGFSMTAYSWETLEEKYKAFYLYRAELILSHKDENGEPDLALIDREEGTVIERDELVGGGIETTRYLPCNPS